MLRTDIVKPSRDDPPPGPFRHDFWRSPIRGPWLSSVLSSALLPLIAICTLTGFASHVSYESELGRNQTFERDPFTKLLDDTFDWPAATWLYAVNQGLHVVCGLLLFPVLLAKLWAVIPKLFEWPPIRSVRHAMERGGLALLVGGSLFVLGTGIINLQYWYPWNFAFVPAHYYGAIVFLAGLVAHVIGKVPEMRRTFREEGVTQPLRGEEVPPGGTITRRGALAVVGAGSVLLALQGLGQAVGGPLRSLALFAPRRQSFPVNKTARAAGVTPAMMGASWRLVVGDRSYTREELLALPQHTESLPIACVEGWSTTQTWTGVRLKDLGSGQCFVESLQPKGALREATLSADQVADDRSLLALRVNGEDLSLDHGYPARIIVPALPGVHNTKWVARMTFR